MAISHLAPTLTKLRPMTVLRINASSSPGSPTTMSSNLRTSGGPYSWIRAALAVVGMTFRLQSASDHRSPARRAARMLLGSWWRMVAAGVICPKAEDRPRQRQKLGALPAGGGAGCLSKQPRHEEGAREAGPGPRAAREIAGMNLEEI